MIKKKREEDTEEVLVKLENFFSNFQMTVDKKDKRMQENIRLLKLVEIEYQRVLNENKSLKQEIELIKKQNQIEKQTTEKIKTNKKKRI